MNSIEKHGKSIAFALCAASFAPIAFSVLAAEDAPASAKPVARSAAPAVSPAPAAADSVTDSYYTEETDVEEQAPVAAAAVPAAQFSMTSELQTSAAEAISEIEEAEPVETVQIPEETDSFTAPAVSLPEEPVYEMPIAAAEPAEDFQAPTEDFSAENLPAQAEESEPAYIEEAPVFEETVMQAPVFMQAAVQAPVFEAPAPEAPVFMDVTDEPAAEEVPAVEEQPVYEEQPAEEPVIQEAPADEIVYEEEPVYTEEPVYEEPAEEPVYTEEPVYEEQPAEETGNSYADLNEAIRNAALGLVGTTDGMQCTEVAAAALRGAGIADATNLWPDEFADAYGYYTDDPQAGNLIYYNNGGQGVDHIAVYIGDGQAVHGNYSIDGQSYTVVAGVEVSEGGTPQYIQILPY